MTGITAPMPSTSALNHIAARPSPQPRPRVRIFNVKYSPNLGDGLLSECLEQALVECGADESTCSIDLAARSAYGRGTAGRSALMRMLQSLPPALRRLAVRLPLAVQSRRRWLPHYRAALRDADCVVIGGGNLIADLDLNFPTKLALAIHEAADRGLPVFIYGCGVSSGWSRQGAALLQQALARGAVRQVFLRDERSISLWHDLFGEHAGLPARLVRDPGLLAGERYGLGASQPRPGAVLVGLNVTAPVAVQYHAAHAPQARQLEDWYLNLAETLVARGFRVAVFTNGSPEDRACAARLRSAFETIAPPGQISFPEADTPGELARLISGLGGLIAFRMHAIIASYACRIPFVALDWDPKLASFVHSIDHGEWLVDPASTPAETAAFLLAQAMANGIAPNTHARVIAQARYGVESLHTEIARAIKL